MNFIRLLLPRIKTFKNLNNTQQFWIGQFFVVLATILGVYLAANVGFKQAISYESLMGEKNKYYIVSSLQSELNDTITETNTLANEVSKHIGTKKIQLPSFYVWESMKRMPETLELPTQIITQTRKYNQNISKILNLYSSKKLGGYVFKKNITKLNSDMNKTLLPKIQKYKEELKTYLSKRDII